MISKKGKGCKTENARCLSGAGDPFASGMMRRSCAQSQTPKTKISHETVTFLARGGGLRVMNGLLTAK
ncbi:hypothetical protein A0U91_04440 [Acetobacter persici]|uniref:Uncharacterized protein n=1 Tax=Acetobacter persici TaxID=1076596 RepID=A0A1U9LD26_9PROT|nr:hypothetical protein A0U91_04440 [Acetobacter persici]